MDYIWYTVLRSSPVFVQGDSHPPSSRPCRAYRWTGAADNACFETIVFGRRPGYRCRYVSEPVTDHVRFDGASDDCERRTKEAEMRRQTRETPPEAGGWWRPSSRWGRDSPRCGSGRPVPTGSEQFVFAATIVLRRQGIRLRRLRTKGNLERSATEVVLRSREGLAIRNSCSMSWMSPKALGRTSGTRWPEPN